MQFIDTHAHVYSKQFDKDRDDMIYRAIEAGISGIFMPNIDLESIDPMLELEQKFPQNCLPMMGLHPCSVNKDFEKALYVLEDWFNKRSFIAVGEMGIDLYWDKSFKEQQLEAFEIQAAWAKKWKLPLVIHSRNAMPETLQMIEKLQDGSLNGVLHCFSGNLQEAQRLVELGFYLGIGGVATYKNGGLENVVKNVPLERLVLETDSPYLAPVPFKGNRNEPFYMLEVAKQMASWLAIPLEQLAKTSFDNSLRLFNTAKVASKSYAS